MTARPEDGDHMAHALRLAARGLGKAELTYRLVASEESDVKAGLISTSSPIGRGLLNKRVGDEVRVVAPGVTLQFEVVRMTTIHGEVIE